MLLRRPCNASRVAAILVLATWSVCADPITRTEASTAARFSWVRGDGAATCPDGTALSRAVTERLGSEPFGATGAVSIEATVAHIAAVWTAWIFARAPDGTLLGERTITSDAVDCGSIADAVALAIALAIDPSVALRAPLPVPPAIPPPRVRAPVPETVPVQQHPARQRPSPVVLMARMVGVVGVVPGVAPGVALAVDGRLSARLRWTLAALYLPESSGQSPATGYGLTTADAGVCIDVLAGRRISLAGCGGILGGVLHAVVYTLLPDAPGDRGWFGAEMTVRLRAMLVGPWTVESTVGAVVPVTRYNFVAPGHPDADFSQSAIAGEAWLGIGVAIP